MSLGSSEPRVQGRAPVAKAIWNISGRLLTITQTVMVTSVNFSRFMKKIKEKYIFWRTGA